MNQFLGKAKSKAMPSNLTGCSDIVHRRAESNDMIPGLNAELVKYKDPIKKMREHPAKVNAMTLGVKELKKHRNKCKLTRLRIYRTSWKI